jgi:hypothetical protein
MFSSLAICATCQVASRVAMAQPLGGMRLPLAIPTKSCSDIRKNSSPTTGRPTPKRFIICFSDGSCRPTPNSQDEILDPLCDVVGSLNQQKLDPTVINQTLPAWRGATLRAAMSRMRYDISRHNNL